MIKRTFLFLLASAAICFPSLPAFSATAAVAPPSVASDYAGVVTLTITGVSSGATVYVEIYEDTNANSAVNAGNDEKQMPASASSNRKDRLVMVMNPLGVVRLPFDQEQRRGQENRTQEVSGCQSFLT